MNLKKSVAIVGFGTLLEWAEFTFFAYMADYLSSMFFSVDDPTFARLKIYGVFAASYIMRPIGAIIFGHIGDRYGRKTPMIASLLLMAAATFGIGILPTYNSIGGVSSALLIILRMIQGIAVGGEFNGATVLLTEYDKSRPFLAGSWTSFAASAGMALGSLAATIVSHFSSDFLWRLPFLLSAVIALAAIYMRRDMEETEDFCKAKENNELFDVPISAAWKHNKAGLACTAAFSIFVSVFVYTGNIYYRTMAVSVGGLPAEDAATAITVGIVLDTVLIPIFAYLADRSNGYKLCFGGLFLALILSPLIMSLATDGNFAHAIAGQLIYGVLDATVSATAFTILLRHFKTGTKYSGSSMAWSVSTAIFGGTALMINEFLVGRLNMLAGPGLYMSLSAFLCLVTVGYLCRGNLSGNTADSVA
ncbi:MAG: MFS transporter [Holosporaceae bacterium]|jgi:MHS family proline/betaine transporter-like MFS transporter|nr:MFS transporter [Holosporaceae bacterium]